VSSKNLQVLGVASHEGSEGGDGSVQLHILHVHLGNPEKGSNIIWIVVQHHPFNEYGSKWDSKQRRVIMSINLKPLSTAISFLYHQSKDLDKLTLFLNLNGSGIFRVNHPRVAIKLAQKKLIPRKNTPFPTRMTYYAWNSPK